MDEPEILQRRVGRFESRSGSVSDCASRLRELGVRVCSFENLAQSLHRPVVVPDSTVAGLLDEIVAQNPGYRWDQPTAGLVNLYPQASVLDSPVPTVSVRSKGAWRALEDDVDIGVLGISIFQELGDPDGPAVDLDLEGADLRTSLNAVVGEMEPLVWQVSGMPGAYHLSFTSVPGLPGEA